MRTLLTMAAAAVRAAPAGARAVHGRVLSAEGDTPAADALVPGIRLTPGRGSGCVVRGRGGCIPAVYLDGMPVGAGAVDPWTTPDGLEGTEVSSDPGAPVEYDRRGYAGVPGLAPDRRRPP
jgi:hypothetical protein